MKRVLFSIFSLTGFIFPLLAQVDHDYKVSDVVPVESLMLKKDQIPPAIVNAVNADFKTGKPLTWGKFPYTLADYGWVVSKEAAAEKPDQYEVFIKAADGSDVYAVYKPDGTIIQSRSIYKNAPIPEEVRTKLANSQYKDWAVAGDKELIRYYNYKKDIIAHFRLTVEKNNVKRTISFNYKEPASK